MRLCPLLFLFILTALRTAAQAPSAVAAFDSQYVETGNPFILHLSVPEGSGTPGEVDFSPWADQLPAQNILRQTAWQKAGGQWVRDVTLLVFDSSHLSLPPLGIVLSGGDTVHTNPVELNVLPTPAPAEPSLLRDIKDIRRTPFNWRDYIFPVLPILAGVLLFVGVLWWAFSRRKKTGLRTEYAFRQAPHELALRKLAALEKQQHWQNGRLKEYYSELTHTLREYLEQRYRIPALELPSEDMLHLLIRTDLPARLLPPLSELLRWADLVKFAKGVPPESFHAQALQQARELVEQSAPPAPQSDPNTQNNTAP